MAHGDDLFPVPDLESEGSGSPTEDSIGAIIERVERGDHATVPDPDVAGAEEISREIARQLATQIVRGQRKSRIIQRFFFNFEIVSTGISSPCKNLFGKIIQGLYCLSQGKASVFPRLCMEAEEYPRDLLSPSGLSGASTSASLRQW